MSSIIPLVECCSCGKKEVGSTVCSPKFREYVVANLRTSVWIDACPWGPCLVSVHARIYSYILASM